MPRLNEIAGKTPSESPALYEIRLRSEKEAFIVFMDDTQEVSLHFEKDPAYNRWVHCIGEDCPYCLVGSKPNQAFLLAVYGVETRRIGVLLMWPELGPGTLLSIVNSHASAKDVGDTMLRLSRQGNRFSSETRPLIEGIDRGEKVILAFRNEVKAKGLHLDSIIPRLGREEIESIPRMRLKLQLEGHLPIDPRANEDVPF